MPEVGSQRESRHPVDVTHRPRVPDATFISSRGKPISFTEAHISIEFSLRDKKVQKILKERYGRLRVEATQKAISDRWFNRFRTQEPPEKLTDDQQAIALDALRIEFAMLDPKSPRHAEVKHLLDALSNPQQPPQLPKIPERRIQTPPPPEDVTIAEQRAQNVLKVQETLGLEHLPPDLQVKLNADANPDEIIEQYREQQSKIAEMIQRSIAEANKANASQQTEKISSSPPPQVETDGENIKKPLFKSGKHRTKPWFRRGKHRKKS